MKLRQRPEDFQVTEVSDVSLSKEKKEYTIYLLEKKGLETFALLGHLSEGYKIPRKEIGIAGLKDKHALTKQYVSIPTKYGIEGVQEKSFTLTLEGYSDTPIKTGSLLGNKFLITVRGIARGELDGAHQKAEHLESVGVPNYFDAQRFGSVVEREFIGKALVQKRYEHAVKLYLTQTTRFEPRRIKDEKKKILEQWKTLETVRSSHKPFIRVLDTYRRTKDWLASYQVIPSQLREMYVNAYQSYLWNECVKELLKRELPKTNLYPIEYPVGSLLFYRKITPSQQERLRGGFPMICPEIEATEEQREIVNKVLAKEGVTLPLFDIKGTGNYFGKRERAILAHPREFSIGKPEKDEMNANRFKITLSFMLPKGSYATLITKRLFNR